MAHKKAGGSSRNGRDSNPKMLGVKLFGGEAVAGGNVIVRQRGTKFYAGEGVGMGKDHTLFALREGRVSFATGYKRTRQPRWQRNKAAEDIGRQAIGGPLCAREMVRHLPFLFLARERNERGMSCALWKPKD